MADIGDIKDGYDAMDDLWRNSMIRMFGEDVPFDFTGARYEGVYPVYGDEKRAYVAAQENKKEYVLQQIGFEQGQHVLDVGSGWGNMLKEIAERGGHGVGLTLSKSQQAYCQSQGWDARLMDWNDYQPERKFDAVVSIGAFEHFCRLDEYQEGGHEKQVQIYGKFFEFVHKASTPQAKLFLQSMIFGSRGPPDLVHGVDPRAPKGSPARILAQWRAYFPGSYMPNNEEQVVEAAEPFYKLVRSEDGRRDYAETARVWLEAVNAPGGLEKWLEWGKFALMGLGRPELVPRVQSVLEDAFSRGFALDIIGHRRWTFEKK